MHDSQLDTSADDCIASETILEIIEKHSDEPASVLVLCLYLIALDRGDKQPPSQRTLIERTGISPRTVRTQLDTLQELDLVEERRDPHDPRYNMYKSSIGKK